MAVYFPLDITEWTFTIKPVDSPGWRMREQASKRALGTQEVLHHRGNCLVRRQRLDAGEATRWDGARHWRWAKRARRYTVRGEAPAQTACRERPPRKSRRLITLGGLRPSKRQRRWSRREGVRESLRSSITRKPRKLKNWSSGSAPNKAACILSSTTFPN